MERREEELQQLKAQFSATNLMDEKTELVVQFLNRLWNSLEQEPMLAATNDQQRSEARLVTQVHVLVSMNRVMLQESCGESNILTDLHGCSLP